jgi:hypothetical protein
MSKPAFFTHPLIHVTGHEGSLSLFLSALIYHAVNPGTTAPLANRYNYSWFGAEAQPGGYYYEWLSICSAMDENSEDPINSAYVVASDWASTGKHHVIESTRPESVMEQLFGSHKHIILYANEEDRYQIAHNYIMLDCMARKWQGFEKMLAGQYTPEELYELFSQPTHANDATAKEIIKTVGNNLYLNTLDPDDEPIPDALNLFYSQYADPACAEETVNKITEYLGDLVVVDPAQLTTALQNFLKTIITVDV